MPMTPTQASTQNIVNSVKDWIVAQVKPSYDNKAATSSSWTAPLNVVIQNPDDPSIYAKVPAISIALPEDVKSPTPLGLGEGIVWRYKRIHLCCYPGVDTNGKPSVTSTSWLQTYVDYAFGTALTMPINDYSSGTVVNQVDIAYVEDQRIVHPRGHIDTTLAIERHRFDMIFTLKYTVIAING